MDKKTDRDWLKHPALAEYALAAIKLAIVGSASPEVAVKVISQILAMAHEPNEVQKNSGVVLFLDAVRVLNLRFNAE